MKNAVKFITLLALLITLSTIVCFSETKSISPIISTSNGITPAVEDIQNSLSTDITILYNNAYYESNFLQDDTLTASITVSNSGVSRDLTCYLAEYNLQGKLIELTPNNAISVPTNETITANITKKFTNTNTAFAKILLWDNSNLKPITNEIVLQPIPIDYYADIPENAQHYDITKVINGRINSVNDIDYIKFIPTTSDTYIIHCLDGTVNCTLYDNTNTLISNGIVENNRFYIKGDFTANETYYIKISSDTVGNYSLMANPCPEMQLKLYNTSISLFGNALSTVGASQSVTIKLLNSRGTILSTHSITTSTSGDFSTSIPVAVENDQYRIIVTTDKNFVTYVDLTVLKDTVTHNVNSEEFCSVPYIISNATTLKNIYFSLCFDLDDFDIYDVCEYTRLVENGTGLISGGNVNIIEKTNSSCIFKSTHAISNNWSGTVNSIKLKSKRAGTKETIRFVYQVK